MKLPRYNSQKLFWMLAITFLLLGIPVLAQPYQEWVTGTIPIQGWSGIPLNYNGPSDQSVVNWFLENASSNAFIISDVDTSLIVQAATGVAGVWNSLSFLNNSNILSADYYFLAAPTAGSAMRDLQMNFSVAKYTFYVVITGRTSLGIASYEESTGFPWGVAIDNIHFYSPVSGIPSFNGMAKFSDRTYFIPVMQSSDVLIYQVKIPPTL